MENVLENNRIIDEPISDEMRSYYSKKLLEGEKYDGEHPERYTMAQIKEMLNSEYAATV